MDTTKAHQRSQRKSTRERSQSVHSPDEQQDETPVSPVIESSTKQPSTARNEPSVSSHHRCHDNRRQKIVPYQQRESYDLQRPEMNDETPDPLWKELATIKKMMIEIRKSQMGKGPLLTRPPLEYTRPIPQPCCSPVVPHPHSFQYTPVPHPRVMMGGPPVPLVYYNHGPPPPPCTYLSQDSNQVLFHHP